MSVGSKKQVKVSTAATPKAVSSKNSEQKAKWPDLARVVSLQKISIKSKSRIEQISSQQSRNDLQVPANDHRNRRQLLPRRPRTQGTYRMDARNSKSRRANVSCVDDDENRPATVALPYIAQKQITKKSSHVRAKSLFSGSAATEDVRRVNLPTKFDNAAEVTSRSRADTETRDYFQYPVDKDERENVENRSAITQLCPVSYTYLLMLEENPQSSMELRNHGLGANSLSVIGSSLENNNIVKELDLEGNVLNNVGIEDLGIVLRGNTTIEHLNLSSNTFSSKGIIAIGNLLDANKTLTSLSLSRNKLTDTDLELLCSSLEDSSNNLKSLDLSFNSFTPEVGNTLGRFLAISDKLEDLCIAGNNLGNNAMRPIFGGLRSNHALAKLDVGCNEICDRGIQIMADMKTLSKKLEHLDLSDNFITSQGIKEFMPLLDGNDSLVVLKLDNNHIGTNGLIFVLETLLDQLNDSLSQLHARGIFADQTIHELCDKIRSRNSKFVLFGVTGNKGNNTNDSLTLLQMYLSRNKFFDANWSERIDSITD